MSGGSAIKTRFSVVGLAPAPTAYVSSLGSGGENRAGSSGGQTSFTLAISPVAILADETIFIGMATNQNSGPPKNTGWSAIDNLGNVYLPPIPPGQYGGGGLSVGLLTCLNPTPGTLTSITVSWTGALTTDGTIAMRVHRFRNVGAQEPNSPVLAADSGWTSGPPTFILKDPAGGSAGCVAISVFGCRTQGSAGDPYAPNGSTYLGFAQSPATFAISNSSHVTVWMGYKLNMDSGGIGHSILTFTGNNWAHVGAVYSAYNPWP